MKLVSAPHGAGDDGTSRRSPALCAAVTALALICIVASASPARAERPYDPQRAGHPVRIVAYVVHPIGVVLDYLVFRPAWWVGRHEPFRTLFGVTD